MDKILNPIYPGDDDPNARFLEEHILRTSIPSECDKTFSMYGLRHSTPPTSQPGIQPRSSGYLVPRQDQSCSYRPDPRSQPTEYPRSQHDNDGSSTTASATTIEALWNEVKKKIDTTSKIKVFPETLKYSNYINIKFFREIEEICQITIPRNPFADFTNCKVSWGTNFLPITSERLQFLRLSVNNEEFQKLFSTILKFEPEKKKNENAGYRYFVHDDNYGMSCKIASVLDGTDMMCRKLLMPGKLVFVFPNELQTEDMNKIITHAKSGRIVNILKYEFLEKTEYEVISANNRKFDIVQFQGKNKPMFYRRDFIYDNVFYKIKQISKFKEKLKNLVPHQPPLPAWRPWEENK
eukprot:GHVP01034468.1.p1 GENE.GHVP01034468.1~~GHVP01034468.1.p1  ORF type:complete len:351 (+),score=36.10 GHVP01034468.1:2-1054(+)